MFEFIEKFWADLIDVLLYIPRRVFELMMSALADLLSAIPVPAFILDMPTLFASVPAGITWGFWLFNVGFGVSITVSAYVLRFLIRRIPVIG